MTWSTTTVSPTLDELADEYLAQHVAEANTIRTLTERLRYARSTFGHVRVDRLQVAEIGAWRKRLPERSAWHIHKALRQLLHYAVAVGVLADNPAVKVRNPEPKRREIPRSRRGRRSTRLRRSSGRRSR